MTRLLRRAPCCLTLLAATALAAEPARPQSEADHLFTRARGLLAQKKFAEACPLLEKSHKLEPALGTLLNLADCLEKWGRPAAAFVAFNEAAAWAARNKEAKREEVALQRAQALKPKLAQVAVELAAPAPNAKAKLSRAGDAAEAPPLREWSVDGTPQTVPLDPGAYVVRVDAPGRVGSSASFQVGATPGLTRVSVPALALVDVPPPAPDPTLPPPPLLVVSPPSAKSPAAAIGIVNVAAGGALIVASAICLGYSRTVLDRVERQQPGGPDFDNPTVTRQEFTTVQTLYPASWVGLGVGLAAAGTGTFLLIRELRSAPVVVSAGASSQGAFASVSGSF